MFWYNFKQLEINERDARRVQTLATIFQIASISVATKRPGRPRGSANKRKAPTGQRTDATDNVRSLPDNFIDLTEQSTDPISREVTTRRRKRTRSNEIGFNVGSNRLITKANVVCADDDEVAMEEDDDFEPFVTNLAKDCSNACRASGSRNEDIENSNEVMDLNIQVSNEMLNHT